MAILRPEILARPACPVGLFRVERNLHLPELVGRNKRSALSHRPRGGRCALRTSACAHDVHDSDDRRAQKSLNRELLHLICARPGTLAYMVDRQFEQRSRVGERVPSMSAARRPAAALNMARQLCTSTWRAAKRLGSEHAVLVGARPPSVPRSMTWPPDRLVTRVIGNGMLAQGEERVGVRGCAALARARPRRANAGSVRAQSGARDRPRDP
jgi:hypothetical protein